MKATGRLVNVLYRIRVTDEEKESKEVHQLQDQTLALRVLGNSWQFSTGRRPVTTRCRPSYPIVE